MHADNFFKNRDEDTEGVGAQNGTLGDLGDVFGFGNGDSETVASVDVEHNVNIRAAVAGVDDVVRADFLAGLKFIEEGDFAVASGGADDGVDFAGGLVNEFCAVNVIGGQQAFEGAADDFNGSGGENVKIKMIAFDAVIEDLVEQTNVGFETNLFSDLNQVFFADAGTEVGIMEKQIGEFGALLDQIELGHALGLALEFRGGNADDFGKDVAGVIESQSLVEVADEKIGFEGAGIHGLEHSW